MTTDEYDQLLEDIRTARELLAKSMERAKRDQVKLEWLLHMRDREDSRIARAALTSTHSASRKLVVGE